jgi:uncharacterized integral membrane protein
MPADDREPPKPPAPDATPGKQADTGAGRAADAPAVAGEATPHAPPRTRTSAAYKALLAGLVVLVLLLVFMLENTQSVKISYFGATGHLPLGVALLLAAAGGALLAALVGGARILQLRRHAKRRRGP